MYTYINKYIHFPCPFEPNVSFSARIHCSKVSKAVNLLKTGVGFGGIHTNHLTYSSKLLIFALLDSLIRVLFIIIFQALYCQVSITPFT